MALNYDLTKIKNSDALCWVPDPKVPESERTDDKGWTMSPVTDAIIFMTIGVDMGEITENNLNEFYWRVRFIEKFLDIKMLAVQNKAGKVTREYNPTFKQIKAHIGLKCNVTTKSRAQFMQRMRRAMEDRMNEILYQEKRAANDKKEKQNGSKAA